MVEYNLKSDDTSELKVYGCILGWLCEYICLILRHYRSMYFTISKYNPKLGLKCLFIMISLDYLYKNKRKVMIANMKHKQFTISSMIKPTKSCKTLSLKDYQKMGFDTFQLSEIGEGLDENLDVTIYANQEFNWMQMAVIRRGLELDLDVSVYARSKYTEKEMLHILNNLIANNSIRIRPNTRTIKQVEYDVGDVVPSYVDYLPFMGEISQSLLLGATVCFIIRHNWFLSLFTLLFYMLWKYKSQILVFYKSIPHHIRKFEKNVTKARNKLRKSVLKRKR